MTRQSRTVDIGPRPTLFAYLVEAWQSRGIALFLAWRDVLVKYKQTLIGVVWVVARPLLFALIFAFVFGGIAGLSSGGVPYMAFVLAALLPWQFLAASIGQGSECLVANAGMITKIYFPRLLLPVSAVLGNLVDFAVAIPLLIGILIWFGILPSVGGALAAGFWLLVLCALTLGLSAILAALNAQYRDVRYLVPFLLQAALYISPIGYGVDSVPEGFRWAYCFNPLVGLFEGLRSSFLSIPNNAPGWAVVWSVVFSMSALLGGIILFWRSERRIVDVI